MSGPLLELVNVKTHFPIYRGVLFPRRIGTVKAVDGVSLQVHRAEIVGLVGESGCGKSTLARTIVQLVRPTSGAVLFDGQDLGALSHAQMRRIRPRLQIVFQDPHASLNPRKTVFEMLAEPMRVHRRVPRRQAVALVADVMSRVGLLPRYMRKYPHEFSGGQRQRIAIARALALNPELIIADEPVSALDVSVQAQILNLLAALCKETVLTLLLISHDLAVVKHLAHRIAVMYLGRIVEIGDAIDVFEHPRHPYTKALISAISIPDPEREANRKRIMLPGEPPSPLNPPAGCGFHPRCPYVDRRCTQIVPPLEPCGGTQEAACLRLDFIA